MTSLGTAILLTLTGLCSGLGSACDSNPTPHPANDAGRTDTRAPNIGGGEVTGTELPGRGADDDFDPAVPDNDNGSGFESCPDADAYAGDGANGEDDNETRSGESEDVIDPDQAEDCGEGDSGPVPGASSDYGQVEGNRQKEEPDRRPTRAP